MAHSSSISPLQNAVNAALIVLVAIPAVWYAWFLHHRCSGTPADAEVHWTDRAAWATPEQWCALGRQPIASVNVVFFLNVCVLFWVISLVQKSTWLIDPYWTIIPVMIGLFYERLPGAAAAPARRLRGADSWRSAVATYLLWLWSVRLTHSYFRRERWLFGAREDWRFAGLSTLLGRHWWWASFLLAFASQQAMLVGITLPLRAIYSSARPWHTACDGAIALVAAAGILVAFRADNELADFMAENERRRQAGEEPVLLLDTGLWRYSRHPNYFGEQLWWWGLGLWAVRLGQPWMLLGAAFNSLCMVAVTVMVERRMLAKPERAEQFQHYCRTTSAWVPWFKGAAAAAEEEEQKEE